MVIGAPTTIAGSATHEMRQGHSRSHRCCLSNKCTQQTRLLEQIGLVGRWDAPQASDPKPSQNGFACGQPDRSKGDFRGLQVFAPKRTGRRGTFIVFHGTSWTNDGHSACGVGKSPRYSVGTASRTAETTRVSCSPPRLYRSRRQPSGTPVWGSEREAGELFVGV